MFLEIKQLKFIEHVVNAAEQCDEFGFVHNALVPMTHSLEAPGGPLKYCLDGHDFAVFGCSLTTDQRYVISTSTRQGMSERCHQTGNGA